MGIINVEIWACSVLLLPLFSFPPHPNLYNIVTTTAFNQRDSSHKNTQTVYGGWTKICKHAIAARFGSTPLRRVIILPQVSCSTPWHLFDLSSFVLYLWKQTALVQNSSSEFRHFILLVRKWINATNKLTLQYYITNYQTMISKYYDRTFRTITF